VTFFSWKLYILFQIPFFWTFAYFQRKENENEKKILEIIGFFLLIIIIEPLGGSFSQSFYNASIMLSAMSFPLFLAIFFQSSYKWLASATFLIEVVKIGYYYPLIVFRSRYIEDEIPSSSLLSSQRSSVMLQLIVLSFISIIFWRLFVTR
jgi:hypothetical protein